MRKTTCAICGEERDGPSPSYCRACARGYTSGKIPRRPRRKKKLTCSRCGALRDGAHTAYCLACQRDYARSRYDSVAASISNRQQLLRRFNLTEESFRALLRRQGGGCAICLTDQPGGKTNQWHVDHDHSCCPGKRTSCGRCVRGLLCSNCNTALGLFRDEPMVLEAAIAYVKNPDAAWSPKEEEVPQP